MNRTMIKTTVREIRHSIGRFISIMCIVALGVGFFAGLKTARADMINTADDYLSELAFYDYRLVGTLGFDDESVALANEDDAVSVAEGSYSTDLIVNISAEELVFKAYSIPESVNKIKLTAGRSAVAENECVVDGRFYSENEIGKTITVSDKNKKDTKNMLKSDSFTIVGIANSPIYLNYERGTTSLLSGSISAFIYMPKAAFNSDYYTEVYLRLAKSYGLYSAEYDDYIDEMSEKIDKLSKTLADKRFTAVTNEALDEYESGYEEYEEKLSEYNDEKATADKKLAEAFDELNSAEINLADKQKEYENGLAEYKKNYDEYNDGQKKVSDGLQAIDDGILQAQAGAEKLSAAIAQLEAAPTLDESSAATLAGLKIQLEDAQKTLNELTTQKSELNLKQSELNEAKIQLDKAKSELDDGKKQLADGRKELAKGKSEYYSEKEKADDEFSKAKAKLDDAKEELADAKKEIDDIKYPDDFVLGRDTNVGYICFDNDSGIVDGLAEVFPVFFFLVAALMCMTTMTRMVDEQRTDIGVMKALGYSKSTIMGKYVAYSGLAAIFGSALGFFGGSYLFPNAIWAAYKIMYGFAPLQVTYNPLIAAFLLIIALICTIGATILSCKNELNANAAQIMRPKTLKGGKHAFFEKWKIFRNLKFLRKVSVRNLLRYKRRLFMMVLGIAGCTALLITGFGIRDSVQKIGDYQYGEIMTYDYVVDFSEGMSEQNQLEFSEAASYVNNLIFVHTATYDITTNDGVKSADVIATDKANIGEFISLKNGEQSVEYPKNNFAVVSKKFANINGLSVGSEIKITDSNLKSITLKVSGICENYVNNYVYVTYSSLASGFGYSPEVKTAYINSDDNADVHSIAAKLMNEDNVMSVTVCEDTRERVAAMLNSLNYIVLLIIVCAGALAFVVLYNLTNINITERKREIATIKVLGFYANETSSYVFGENFVLTGLGAVVGLLLGRLLHAFVMSKINIDMVSFNVRIDWLSFVWSILLTFLFAVVVDFFMYFKLQKIDMAQSLKSVE